MASSYIILVNWNGYCDTIECLETLLRLDNEDFHVIVVDNGSTDGSIKEFQRWSSSKYTSSKFESNPVWDTLPQKRRHKPSLNIISRYDKIDSQVNVTIVDAGKNLGFAGANNIGLALAAQDIDCKWIWLLNNDTVVASDALSVLIAHGIAYPDQGIIGSTLLYYYSPDIVQGVGGWLDQCRAKAGHIGTGLMINQLPDLNDIERELAYVMGASMFVRRTTYDIIGGMSEDYFLYYEELDWARQLPSGITQGWSRNALVFHKEGGSIGSSSTADRPSDTSLYYLRRGLIRFYWRHERVYFLSVIMRILGNLAKCIKRGDKASIRVSLCVFADVFTGRFRRGAFGSAEFLAAERH